MKLLLRRTLVHLEQSGAEKYKPQRG